MKQFKWVAAAALVASLGIMQGCTMAVSHLSDDGKSDEIIFPDAKNDAWVKEGTFPNIDNLRSVAPGMTKDQLYALLGRPHFREGMGGVREWDYIFNFRKEGGAVEICQYKVIYSPELRVSATHWKPESCADYLKPPAPQVVERVVERIIERPAPAPAPAEPKRVRLGTDGLFAFNKSGIADLRPGGVEKLNQVAADLTSGGEIERVKVVGHADRIGGEAYNLKLSQARANTVRQYLASKGIPAERITATGVGKSMPLVQCKQTKRDELIKCLEPNRRVEIEAWTVRKQ